MTGDCSIAVVVVCEDVMEGRGGKLSVPALACYDGTRPAIICDDLSLLYSSGMELE